MTQLKALAFGVSLFAISGAATAGDLVVLGDDQLDNVTAAGNVDFLTNVIKAVDIDKNVDLLVNKQVDSVVAIEGALATAEASADAVGFENVLAETDSFAQVAPFAEGGSGAFSFSEALAAGNDVLPPPPPPNGAGG